MHAEILKYIDQHEQDFVKRLNTLLRIPSISTLSEHQADVRKACDFVKDQLTQAGLQTTVLETKRHPSVFADTGPAKGPTVLIYGHYDVQPTGDEKLWKSPPFEPTLRDGAIFARGSADDKGQFLCHTLAAEAWLKSGQRPRCRLKFLIEGEEEIGSPNLEPLVRENRERLACDLVVISDTAKLSREKPAITYGTKGLVYKEIRLYGPSQNKHSGVFGGTMANPGNALAGLIAAMHDSRRKVAIPDFYKDVADMSADERKAIAALPFDEKQYLRDLGSPSLVGEEGYSTLERRWARPTLDVNGLFGGYAGEGAMTIIPAMCGAKVSMRIVPNQTAEKISKMFDDFVRARCPDSVRLEIETHSGADPWAAPLDLPALKAARRAVAQGFGVEPAMIREGGTIPIMVLFKKHLGADSVLLGFSDPNCNLHGPNEFFHVSDFMAGIRTAAYFLEEVGSV
jgi:acetylornithine deacetylase/succinyl-diaminopimelate desuccinylase-like protein